jgi:hypothetical protein
MKFITFIFAATLSCSGQVVLTGPAQTSGPCSPAVSGSNNQFTIKCSGINKAQGEELLKLLNKISQNQVDPRAVIRALDEMNSRIPRLKGVLVPANDPDPLPECKSMEGQLKLVLGTNAWIEPVSENILEIGDHNKVAIRRTEKGISVDAEFSGEDQHIVARIQGNAFTLNPNNVFDVQTPDNSTLVVHSVQNGTEILNVRFPNKNTVRINAIFFLKPGVRFEVNEKGFNGIGIPGIFSVDHSCFYRSAGFQIH